MLDRNPRLTVEVRLLPDPCLWCWEIRDAHRNEVLESSWAGEWTAYSSPEEALRAGRRRLTARPAAFTRHRPLPGLRAVPAYIPLPIIARPSLAAFTASACLPSACIFCASAPFS